MDFAHYLLPITPFKVIIYLIVVNLLTFGLYGMDKRAAINKRWRVPEKSFHIMHVVGGSPAAYFAQRYFRHKTRKESFQTEYWLIVILQILGIAYYIYTYMITRH